MNSRRSMLAPSAQTTLISSLSVATCHLDEDHPMNTINGVCPVCAVKVSSDMVAHITLQHSNMFKMTTRKRKARRGGAQSMLSMLKREFPGGNFQSLFEGSSRVVVSSSSSSIAADPLLSSFISPMEVDELFNSESQVYVEEKQVLPRKH